MANPNLETVTPQNRIVASLPFVESVARRVAASMPHTIDLGDLVQDVPEAAVEEGHSDELVQPEALPVERGEPERRFERGQRDDR